MSIPLAARQGIQVRSFPSVPGPIRVALYFEIASVILRHEKNSPRTGSRLLLRSTLCGAGAGCGGRSTAITTIIITITPILTSNRVRIAMFHPCRNGSKEEPRQGWSTGFGGYTGNLRERRARGRPPRKRPISVESNLGRFRKVLRFLKYSLQMPTRAYLITQLRVRA